MLHLHACQFFHVFQLAGHFCARLEHDTGAAIVEMSTIFISLIAAVVVKHIYLLIIIVTLADAVVVVMISTVLGRLTRFTLEILSFVYVEARPRPSKVVLFTI